MGALLLWGDAPVSTLAGALFTILGALFVVMFAGLVGRTRSPSCRKRSCASRCALRAGRSRCASPKGTGLRLPFSYIIGNYSFAPYIAPGDVPMRVGAPYVVYYAARSRLLLSLAALDAPTRRSGNRSGRRASAPGET